MNDRMVASGGLIAPAYAAALAGPFRVTYRVRSPWRRWRLRREGWSTEWTVEYEGRPVREALPQFAATRGGIRFDR